MSKRGDWMKNKKMARLANKAEKPAVEPQSRYERKGIYSLDAVFAHTPDKSFGVSKALKAEFDGDMISMTSSRYMLFKRSVCCVRCGLNGEYFAKERSIYQPEAGFHFNLYGTNAKGEEVMLTKDHIIPKSKGGKNNLSNYQTMCSPCNNKKGDKSEVKEILTA